MEHGRVSVHGRISNVTAGIAIRLVRAVWAGRKIWIQYHDAENLVAGSAERIIARGCARLSTVGSRLENCRVDGRAMVALGVGSDARVSIAHARARAGFDSTAVQQIHAAAGRKFAR